MQNLLNILLAALIIYQLYNFYLLYKAPTITAPEAKKLKKNSFFVDVRTEREYTNGHIPGARNIPLNQLSKRMNEIPKDTKVIVVCQSGSRSARGTMKLLKSGYSQVFSLKGGMIAWK